MEDENDAGERKNEKFKTKVSNTTKANIQMS
jgi:hypothetical protein